MTEVGEVKHYAKASTDSGLTLANVFPFNNLDGDTSCFYTVSGDTTWLGTSGGSAPLMVMVQPLDSVAVWRWTYVIWTDSAVVAGKTDVIVPAGTFKNCYEVNYYGFLGQLYYRVCYAKGVGAVKGEGFTSPTWKFELKSADLPKHIRVRIVQNPETRVQNSPAQMSNHGLTQMDKDCRSESSTLGLESQSQPGKLSCKSPRKSSCKLPCRSSGGLRRERPPEQQRRWRRE